MTDKISAQNNISNVRSNSTQSSTTDQKLDNKLDHDLVKNQMQRNVGSEELQILESSNLGKNNKSAYTVQNKILEPQYQKSNISVRSDSSSETSSTKSDLPKKKSLLDQYPALKQKQNNNRKVANKQEQSKDAVLHILENKTDNQQNIINDRSFRKESDIQSSNIKHQLEEQFELEFKDNSFGQEKDKDKFPASKNIAVKKSSLQERSIPSKETAPPPRPLPIKKAISPSRTAFVRDATPPKILSNLREASPPPKILKNLREASPPPPRPAPPKEVVPERPALPQEILPKLPVKSAKKAEPYYAVPVSPPRPVTPPIQTPKVDNR